MNRSIVTPFLRGAVAVLLGLCALAAQAAADANQATRAELESVKGIGPGLSAKILEARKTGAFRNWDDLVERVGGIGRGNAVRLSHNGLTVAGAAYAGHADAGMAAAKPRKAEKTEKAEKAGKAGKAGQAPRLEG